MSIPRRTAVSTPRMLLQPVRRAHAAQLLQATLDSRSALLPWMPWAKDPTAAATLAAARSAERRWREGQAFHFVVTDRRAGQVLGVVGLDRGSDDALELHYWIRTDHTGRGLITEAAQALLEWAETKGLASRFMLWAGRDNAGSRRVAIKLGFIHAGPLDWRPTGGLGSFPAERYERPASLQPAAASSSLSDTRKPAAVPRR
jgi:ribosomal-protein-serine acetyltransferase